MSSPILRFLCGCSSKLLATPVENRLAVANTFDGISFDEEGFIVCSIHHARRYGWRAPSGNKTPHMSDLQWQQLDLFGISPFSLDAMLSKLDVPSFDLRPKIPTPAELAEAIDEANEACQDRATLKRFEIGHTFSGDMPRGYRFVDNLLRVEADVISLEERKRRAA